MKFTSQAEVFAVEDKAEVRKVSLGGTVKNVLKKYEENVHKVC